MTDSKRNILTIFLIILMAVSSFVAGFLINELRNRRGGGLIADDSEMAVFWEAWQRIDDTFIGEQPTTQERTYGAIRGSVALLNDPYTVFIEPQVRQTEIEQLSGNFGGIGATLVREENGDVVLTPIVGNPAENAGILPNDILIAVDGNPVLPEETIAQIADRIKGEKGTTVVLTVIHPNESEPVDIEIERGDILIPSVSFRILEDNPDIGYIQLTRFSGESNGEIQQALTTLLDQGVTKFVLDLRNNGGGLLDAAVDIADQFLLDGTILNQINNNDEKVFSANGEAIAPDQPIVILTNGGTASASEILAGALRDNNRAQLVGTRTFGKGSVQLVYDLSDGSSIHVTSARWFTPNMTALDGQGLEPDVIVETSQEAIDNGRDEVLDRAVEILQ